MPSALSYPGVYIEEISSGQHAIVGVSTSIAAFIGRTAKGPIGRAVRITDRSAFARTYGDSIPEGDLVNSVRQFFDNGGTDCYVVRVAHDAAAATLTLQTAQNADILVATARDKGAAGNDLRLEVDYATAYPDDTFNLRILEDNGVTATPLEEYPGLSMDPSSARFAPTFVTDSSTHITLSSKVANLVTATPAAANPAYSESRRPFAAAGIAAALNAIMTPTGANPAPPAFRFEISVDDGPFMAVNLTGAPLGGVAANVADALKGRINAQIPATTPVAVNWENVDANTRVLRITSNSTEPSSVRIRPSGFEDFAGPMMLGANQGGVEVGRYQSWRPVSTGTVYAGNANDLATLRQDAFTSVTIDAEPPISLMAGATPILQSTAAADLWYQQAAGTSPVTGDNDGVREKLGILAKALNNAPPPPTGIRTFRAEVWGYHLAVIPTTGVSSRAMTVATAPDVAFGTAFRANARRYALGHLNGSTFAPVADTGNNGNGAPDITDFIGDPVDGSGMHALDIVDLFNLMVLPSDKALGESGIKQLAGPASIYCGERRAMFLLDAPTSWTDPLTGRPKAAAHDVDDLRNLVTGKNAAVYYPRLKYSSGGHPKTIGPTGAVAGVMARTDVERGVWKAPAGTEANIRGILDLDANLTDREQGILNKAGANVIRIFPAGIVVWGARTLAGTDDNPSEWKYVPIRRFALFLEESLFRGTKWVVFEPNDEPLWANIRKNIRAFMLGLFRQGAFEGSTPDQAFYVKCDGETTTANDRNLGIVNIEIGFAPLKPAEFVVIRIQQIANDSQ